MTFFITSIMGYCFSKTFLVSICKQPSTDLLIVKDLERLSFLERSVH
ncbi:MAG: hypothetical protein RRZ67_04870 [Victivallaceae bacterium]